MMTQKDYVRAAELIRNRCESDNHGATNIIELAHKRRPCLIRSCIMRGECVIETMENMFVEFFQENPKFDEKRFREACLPRCGSVARKWGKPCSKAINHNGGCNS